MYVEVFDSGLETVMSCIVEGLVILALIKYIFMVWD